MTTKAVTGYVVKDGKLVRKVTLRAGLKRKAVARQATAWKGKSRVT